MPISPSNRMDGWLLADLLINIVFWILVLYISWNENTTPIWMYGFLFFYILFYAIRFILKKEGMDRAVWLYSLNMLVIVYLLAFFSRR